MLQQQALEQRITKTYMNHAPAAPTAANRRVTEEEAKTIILETTNLANKVKDLMAEKGIKTIGQLITHTKGEIERIPGLGKKSIMELDYLVQSYGLYFVKMRVAKDTDI